jgi:hypothetical protein
MKEGGLLSIWFFIGVSLLVNGLLIFGSGVYELWHPPAHPVVLYGLHASLWWGALMTMLGGVYCYHYAPGRKQS